MNQKLPKIINWDDAWTVGVETIDDYILIICRFLRKYTLHRALKTCSIIIINGNYADLQRLSTS